MQLLSTRLTSAEAESTSCRDCKWRALGDRKSTRLNSSHLGISYAVFCLKKKKTKKNLINKLCKPKEHTVLSDIPHINKLTNSNDLMKIIIYDHTDHLSQRI